MTREEEGDPRPIRFAALLREWRRAAGLTQVELAARAGVGVRTLRDLEQGRSVRPQRGTVDLIVAALRLAGPARAEFIAAARGNEPPVPAPGEAGPSVPHDVLGGRGERPETVPASAFLLPPPVRLVDRHAEIEELSATIVRPGPPDPVTLVGPAGVGKSALALAVAHNVAHHFPGGTAGVLIGEGSDDAEVLAAVMTVFGGPAADPSIRRTGSPTLLLVDAVERAPDAVAGALTRLRSLMPDLRVLAGGRLPVGLPGEQIRQVRGLRVPARGVPSALEAASRHSATALFLERLGHRRPQPPTDPDEIGAIFELARLVDGLPLAIELLAALAAEVPLTQLWDGLKDLAAAADVAGDTDVTGVGGARGGPARPAVGSVLRAVVEATYLRLTPVERAAVRRLSVLRNRWPIELAEAMLRVTGADGVGPNGPTADGCAALLTRLERLGLVDVWGTGPVRYRLIDVVRDFAVERLTVEGEVAAVRRRHGVVVAGLAGSAVAGLTGPEQSTAARLLDGISGDLSAALAYAAVDDPYTALALAAALPRWWRMRGRDVPGRRWLRRLLDDPRTADVDAILRAWARYGVARLALDHGDGEHELPSARAALADFQRVGDIAGELATRNLLCLLCAAIGEHEEARRHAGTALALAGRHGRARDLAVAQRNLMRYDIRAGDLAAARRRLAAVDRLAAQSGDQRLRVSTRMDLAELCRLEGRYVEAVGQGRRVLAALTGRGEPARRLRALGIVGLALAQEGRVNEAADVLAQSRLESAADTAAHPAMRGALAMVEAAIAQWRGERRSATRWYDVAVEAYGGCHERRDIVEAMIGLLANAEEPAVREALRDRVDRLCQRTRIVLLPAERKIFAADRQLAPPGPRDGRQPNGLRAR